MSAAIECWILRVIEVNVSWSVVYLDVSSSPVQHCGYGTWCWNQYGYTTAYRIVRVEQRKARTQNINISLNHIFHDMKRNEKENSWISTPQQNTLATWLKYIRYQLKAVTLLRCLCLLQNSACFTYSYMKPLVCRHSMHLCHKFVFHPNQCWDYHFKVFMSSRQDMHLSSLFHLYRLRCHVTLTGTLTWHDEHDHFVVLRRSR